MVSHLITNDKITNVFDNLATKNSEHFSYLKATFREIKTYDHILIEALENKSSLGFLGQSIIQSNQKIHEIIISTFSGKKVTPISKSSRKGKSLITSQTLKRNLGAWKSGYVFKKYDEDSFLLINKYKVNNEDILISKIVLIDDFKNKLDEDKVYTTYLFSKENNELLYVRNQLPVQSMEQTLFDNFHGQNNLLGGVKSFELGGSNYIMAYDEVEEGVIVITLLEESTVLGVLTDLNNKSILFLIVAVSFAGILSVFASKNFTSTLSDLHSVANKLTQGDYSVSVRNKSNDEIGDLAKAFEIMGQKIAKLLSKLKEYNKKLESLVAKRTKELKTSLDLQSTMINSVNEGFMIVDRHGIISRTHSKASEKLFAMDPTHCHFGELIGVDPEEQKEFAGLFNAMINEDAPFDELKQFLPTQITIQNKIIFIDYSPMRNEEGICTNVVITALDKTTEIESIQENERQKEYVRMVLAVLRDKDNYYDFVKQVKNLSYDLESLTTKEFYRKVHTLKGTAGYFHIRDLAHHLHDLEDFIDENMENTDRSIFSEKVDTIKQSLQFTTKNQTSWLGSNPYYSNFSKSVNIDIEKLEKFSLMLKTEDVSFDLYNVFIQHLFSVPLQEKFNQHTTLIDHLSKSENIKLNNVNWEGMDLVILPNLFEEVFSNISHIYRNIMSHAFVGRGNELNEISTKAEFLEKNNMKFLRISIIDNGNGIDQNKLILKLKEKNEYNNMSENKLLETIFEDGVSTSSHVSEITGRGVGLSSLKAAVNASGGQILVRSKKNKGTRFYITLPIRSKYILNGEDAWKKAA